MERIPFSSPNLSSLESEYVSKAMSSGWIGSKGDFVDRFESKFAKFIGVDYAITCSSGTSALQLAYHACGVSDKSIIMVPDTTFIAPYNMARLFTHNVHKTPVNKDTWVLDIGELKGCFVVAVHLYGNPVDMGQVYKQKHTLIEDCAQSIGSKYRGKMTGSYGLASCFSFHSAKIITTGEGGMVCTNNKLIAERIRLLKNHSMTAPYNHIGMGYNARMTNVQAAIGAAQLERIDELIAKKKHINSFYNENLTTKYRRQCDQRNSDVVKWASAYKHDRSPEIRQRLDSLGIETRPGFLTSDTIVFPCSTTLTDDNLRYIVSMANECV